MINASAPGKVVLWGEYAVLAGAPALVMAVNRRAVCDIEPEGDTWRFATHGFHAPDAELTADELLANKPPAQAAAAVAWHVFQLLIPDRDRSTLPVGARVLTDSEDFHLRGEKLGIGSSAAVCTAVYGACCMLLGRSPDYSEALAIHNLFQDKSGSGIDVAAAFHGGLLRFEEQRATPWELPAELQLRFIWTGVAASTTSHVGRFNSWSESAKDQTGGLAPVTELASISKALFEQPDLATLALYTDALKALDAAAALGIYAAGHSQLDHLANDSQVVYKPCGAGGGDIGVAVGNDAAGLDHFVAAATDLGFDSIPLEKATHGLQVAG